MMSFPDYLAKSVTGPGQLRVAERGAATSPQYWIGQLMLNHGLIGVEEINQVLRRQDLHRGFFGENAVALGYLTATQLDTLLAAQELRRNVELLEEMALAGHIGFSEGAEILARYYLERNCERNLAAAI